MSVLDPHVPMRWLCPHCEMEIEAELAREHHVDEAAYVCVFCGWRTLLGAMEYFGLVKPA